MITNRKIVDGSDNDIHDTNHNLLGQQVGVEVDSCHTHKEFTVNADNEQAHGIDLLILNKFRSEMGAEFLEVTAIFLQKLPKRIRAIKKASKKKNAPALARAAHSLKGMSSLLGAIQLASLAGQLENKGNTGLLKKSNNIVARLVCEAKSVKNTLSEYC